MAKSLEDIQELILKLRKGAYGSGTFDALDIYPPGYNPSGFIDFENELRTTLKELFEENEKLKAENEILKSQLREANI